MPLGQQLSLMKLLWPHFACSMNMLGMICTGQLTPTPLSDTYTVRITYNPPWRPKVAVLSPRLRSRPGERIPHTFSGDLLCLHLPGQWTVEMAIGRTIVQWTSLWLFFYETWLFTGKWRGEGHEPPTGKEQ